MGRLIDEEDAINAIRREYNRDDSDFPTDYQLGLSAARKIIEQLPSAQLSRDRQMKPVEKIRAMSELEDKHIEESWAVPHKKAICPKCGYLLNRVFIFVDYNTYYGSQCTYCEKCGQAIDWSDF